MFKVKSAMFWCIWHVVKSVWKSLYR